MIHDPRIKLDDFEPQHHWLGFDVFVWAAKMPGYAVIPKPNPLKFNPSSEYAKWFLNNYQDYYPLPSSYLNEFK